MRKDLYKLLIYSTITNIVFNFVYLFVNLYIWKEHKSITDLALFNLSQFTMWAFAYLFGSFMFYKTSLASVMRLSSTFSVVLFFLLSFCTIKNPTLWITFAGGLYGVLRGLNSSGGTQALGLLGQGEEYTYYFQQNDLWGRIINIVTPLLFAGLLILFNYKTVFILMFIFSITLVILSNQLPKIRPQEQYGKINLYSNFSIKKLFHKKNHRLLPLSYLSGGVFSEFQSIFLIFFTFTITSDKLWVALLNILYTLLSFISIRLYRKFKMKDEAWLFFGIFFAFTGLALSIFLHSWWMVIPNVLLVFGNFYYRTTYFSQQFQAIYDEDPIFKFRVTIWRELLLCVSRAILESIIILLNYFNSNTTVNIYWIMGFTLITSMCVPFIHRSFKIE